MASKYVAQCKVCNSKFKSIIENLHTQGMSPNKIYDYLQALKDPLPQFGSLVKIGKLAEKPPNMLSKGELL